MTQALCFLLSPYVLVTLISLINVSSCLTTIATWYGSPDGFGSDGGACLYEGAVGTAPFNKLVSAASPAIFRNGQGCGECYQVKCNSNPACSGNPVTVTITDSCPGCDHLFDLSGTAFGAMATPGKAQQLRNAGRIKIQYQRVPCNYPGVKITFKVDPGSTPYYFATIIEYVNRDGDLGKVELQNGSGAFIPMQESQGATWKLNSPGGQLHGPLSLRLTTPSGKSVTAQNVIPVGWKPGRIYRSVSYNYPGVKITFKVDLGSNLYYFATIIEYVDGDGSLGKVEIQKGSSAFIPMQQSSGDIWELNSLGGQLNGPFSLRLTTLSGKSITAQNVIPVGWKASQIYRSFVNF